MTIIDKLKKGIKVEDKDLKKEKDQAVVASAKEDKKSIEKNNEVMYHDILKRPYITEKSSMMAAKDNKYIFEVPKTANKVDVRRAIENVFEVSVVSVAIINTPSEKVRLGRFEGRNAGFKKAIVTVKEGDKIDIGI